MRYIFFGTPRFAEIILKKLIDAGMPPSLIIANPDRPSGRKKIITQPPTKIVGVNNGIIIYQPEKPKKDAAELSGQWDFAVVAAYGNIIKKDLLALPKFGTIGVHPSLLPLYRGATPIQSAILAGDKETGVSLYLLDEEVDHGAVLSQKSINILPDDTYISLEEKLADLGAKMLINIFGDLEKTISEAKAQSHNIATFTKKFSSEDGLVNLDKDDPSLIYRKIKALNPEPGVYAFIDNIRTKLLNATNIDGKICITKIQKSGKKFQDSSICLN